MTTSGEPFVPATGVARPRGVAARAGWVLAAIAAALFLASFYRHPIGWTIGLPIVLFAVAAAARPYDAALIAAALGPLSSMLFALAGVEAGGLRVFEAMVLALITGWTLSRAIRPRALAIAPGVAWSAVGLLAAALASAAVSGTVTVAEQFANVNIAGFDRAVLTSYAVDWNPVTSSMLFAEGVVLLLLIADVCGGDREKQERLQRMIVAGAAAAALFNVLRIVTIALSQEESARTFWTFLRSRRVNVHHGDLNAAGSYFAMTLFMAAGLVARAPAFTSVCTALIVAGLWLSGSRTAHAAVLIASAGLGLVWLWSHGRRRLALVISGLAAVGAVIVLWMVSPEGRNADPSLALAIRMDLAKAALAMTRDHPLFGVGLGRFLILSGPYTHMPLYIVRENAHNNFLQILAELGIPGLLLFLFVTGASLAGRRQSGTELGRSGRLAGLWAFLLSCIGGHPLLVPHASYPFWMALGLAAEPSLGLTSRRRAGQAAALIAIAFAATIPFRASAGIRAANLENTSTGFSRWQREPDGSRYRWAAGRSTFFVPASSAAVRIPLQRGPSAPETIVVRILLNGREANRVVLTEADGSKMVRLIVSSARQEGAFARIDLEIRAPGGDVLEAVATDEGGPLRVWRPVVEQ